MLNTFFSPKVSSHCELVHAREPLSFGNIWGAVCQHFHTYWGSLALFWLLTCANPGRFQVLFLSWLSALLRKCHLVMVEFSDPSGLVSLTCFLLQRCWPTWDLKNDDTSIVIYVLGIYGILRHLGCGGAEKDLKSMPPPSSQNQTLTSWEIKHCFISYHCHKVGQCHPC